MRLVLIIISKVCLTISLPCGINHFKSPQPPKNISASTKTEKDRKACLSIIRYRSRIINTNVYSSIFIYFRRPN